MAKLLQGLGRGLCCAPAWPGLASAAAPGGAHPVLGSEPLGTGYLLQLTLGLAVVLLGILVLAWLMRRLNRMQSSAGDSLRVLGGLALGARERMVLVQVGETQLLLGVAPGRVQTLHVLERPLSEEPVAVGESGADSFTRRLQAALGRRGVA